MAAPILSHQSAKARPLVKWLSCTAVGRWRRVTAHRRTAFCHSEYAQTLTQHRARLGAAFHAQLRKVIRNDASIAFPSHDALLVGINTVLVDDPRLTVACGNATIPSRSPGHLSRFPDQARLLAHPDQHPLLFRPPPAALVKSPAWKLKGRWSA